MVSVMRLGPEFLVKVISSNNAPISLSMPYKIGRESHQARKFHWSPRRERRHLTCGLGHTCVLRWVLSEREMLSQPPSIWDGTHTFWARFHSQLGLTGKFWGIWRKNSSCALREMKQLLLLGSSPSSLVSTEDHPWEMWALLFFEPVLLYLPWDFCSR